MNKISSFLKDVKIELGKVVWPSREDTIKHTWFVILSIVVSMAFIGLADYGLGALVKVIFLGE